MYCEFFGFSERPFSMTPDPQFVFLSRNHKEAFAHLLYAVTNRSGFAALIGDIGSGKTTVLRTLLGQLDPETHHTALIFNPCLSAAELLRNINAEFGIPAGEESPAALIDGLNRFLIEENASGRTVVLIIDEAQNLKPEVLEQIRLISNLETEKEKLIQIILSGQPELEQTLARPDMRQLQQRITVKYVLRPMDEEDTGAYIRHRLEVAGGSQKARFSAKAVRIVYRYSGGLPRLINALCERTLLAAYTRDSRDISGSVVSKAIEDMRGDDSSPQMKMAVIAGRAILAAAVIAALFFTIPSLKPLPPEPAKMAAGKPASPHIPVSADPVKPLSDPTGFADSLNAVLALWKAPPIASIAAASAVDRVLSERGMSAYRFNGNLGMLRRIDMPIILEMSDASSEGKHYIAVTRIDGAFYQVTPALQGKVTVTAEDIEKSWSGKGLVIWKNSQQITPVLKSGMAGRQVMSLQTMLRATGDFKGAATGQYDRETAGAVKTLQRRHGLEPDGVAGSQTLLLLSRETAEGEPRLADGKGGSI